MFVKLMTLLDMNDAWKFNRASDMKREHYGYNERVEWLYPDGVFQNTA